jgi:hypothetical protein
VLVDFNDLICISGCDEDARDFSIKHADHPGVYIQKLHCIAEKLLLVRYSLQDLCNQELELSKRDEVFLLKSCPGHGQKGRKLFY